MQRPVSFNCMADNERFHGEPFLDLIRKVLNIQTDLKLNNASFLNAKAFCRLLLSLEGQEKRHLIWLQFAKMLNFKFFRRVCSLPKKYFAPLGFSIKKIVQI